MHATDATLRLTKKAVTAVALLAALFTTQTLAQSDAFSVTVLDMSEDSRHVTVPLNRSIIIETTVEVARADSVAENIVGVRAVSGTQLLLTGKSYGTANVILFDANEDQYVLDIDVELDLARLNDALRKIDPLSTVEAHSIVGNIMLTGSVTSSERAERMVELAQLFLPSATTSGAETVVQNHMRVAGEQQVLLRCVVAEVSRTASRELGFNGFLAGETARDAFLVSQLGGINPINMGAAADALVNQPIPFLTGTEGIPLSPSTALSLGFPRADMQMFINALSNNQLLTVLAEPNLVAVSGETATFLAGGEFPIPVPQGNQQITIEFREFGVRLNFTPVVLGNQQIRLRVAPEVSEQDFSNAVQLEGFVVPGLTTRSTETTVEIGNGQTLAIAGLLSEKVQGIANRVPGIGDLPVLGALFRSVNFKRQLTELVIFVTPEVVAPLDPQQVPAPPTDRVKYASDFELYAMGLLESPPTQGMTSRKKSIAPHELSVHGPWGHSGEGG